MLSLKMIRRHHHYHHHHHNPFSYNWNLNNVPSFFDDFTWWRVNIYSDGYYHFNGYFWVLLFLLFPKLAKRVLCIIRAWQRTMVPVYWKWIGRSVDCVVFTMMPSNFEGWWTSTSFSGFFLSTEKFYIPVSADLLLSKYTENAFCVVGHKKYRIGSC